MKKRLCSIVTFFGFWTIIPAQDVQWARSLGSSVEVWEVAEGSKGSIIAYGIFDDLEFDGTNYSSGGTGDKFGFVASYDADGSEKWITILPQGFGLEAHALETDAMGNSYLMGRVYGDMVVDGQQVLDTDGFFLIKLDSTGKLAWYDDQFADNFDLKTRLSFGDLSMADLAVSSTGELHLLLEFWSTGYTLRGYTDSFMSSSSGFDENLLLIKYDATGSISWAKQSQGQWSPLITAAKATELEIDANGNAILAGSAVQFSYSETPISFAGLPPLDTLQQRTSAFIFKFDPAGNPLWSRQFRDSQATRTSGPIRESERIRDLSIEGNTIYLVVDFTDELIVNSDTLYHLGTVNKFPEEGHAILKLDQNGNTTWSKVYTEPFDSKAQLGVNPATQEIFLTAGFTDLQFPEADLNVTSLEQPEVFFMQLDTDGSFISFDSTRFSHSGTSSRGLSLEENPLTYLASGDLIHTVYIDEYKPDPILNIGSYTISEAGSVLIYRGSEVPSLQIDLGEDILQCQGNAALDAGFFDGASYDWSTGATTHAITVSESGTYSVTVTLGDETAFDEVEVTIDTIPEVPYEDFVEAFGSFTFGAPEGTQIQLTPDSLVAEYQVDSSGTYLISLVTPGGCENSKEINVTINELDFFKGGIGSGYASSDYENPSVAFYMGGAGSGYDYSSVSNDKAFYYGGNGSGYALVASIDSEAFYSGGNGSGYTSNETLNTNAFYSGGTGVGYAFDEMLNTEAFYQGGVGTGYAQNGIENDKAFFKGGTGSGYASAEMVIEVLGLIEDEKVDVLHKIYPNPAIDRVTIEMPGSMGSSTFSFIDIKGNEVLFAKTDPMKDKISLDVSSLPSGTYLIVWSPKYGYKKFGKLMKK